MKKHLFNEPLAAGESNLPNWLVVKNEADQTPEILISGSIGSSWWDESGTSEKQFRDALKTIPKGKQFNVRINSEGGSIKDGLGMYNALKDRRPDVTCYIDGYAVSIASIIALGGEKVISPKSSIWMIHEPWSMTQGNAEDHTRSAEMLDKHGDMLAAIYAEELGKPKDEMRDAMKKETWFTGEEATDFGLADETPEEDAQASFAALDLKKFKNVPQNIKTLLAADANKGHAQNDGKTPVTASALLTSPPLNGLGDNTTQTTPANIMNRKQMLALLKKHGITPPDNATDAEILAMVEGLPVAKQTTPENKEPSTKPDANVTALASQLEIITNQLKTEKETRIKAEVAALAEGRIPAKQVENWVKRAIADETVLNDLRELPINHPGGEPLNHTIVIEHDSPLGKIKAEHKTPQARAAAMKDDWSALYADACKRDSRKGATPMNANTYSGTLVTAFLEDGATTDLQNIWAPLRAFSMDCTMDAFKPKATVVLSHVTAGATTQTNATNFESGDSTVAPVSATMAQYTQSFQVSNSDLQNGLRMEKLVTINAANFANKIIQVAIVPITSTLFTGTPLISAPEAFGFSDLATLQGQLKKSTIKNLILDGEYIARIANTPGFFQQPGVVGGSPNAWKAFGWDNISQNTNWTTAGNNVRGFACNPQAIAGITGLPVEAPNIPGGILSMKTMQVPGLGITVALYTWFNPSTRTMWTSYDIMAGFKEVDTTAGIVIASGTPT